MTLTEDEAKKKWCPFVRFATIPDGAFIYNNRVNSTEDIAKLYSPGDPDGPSRCIASACMAWHWRYGRNHNSSDQGFCGAFGDPQ